MAETDKRAHRPWQATSMGNITRVVQVDLSEGDFTDEQGFFIRSADGGAIRYCPIGNEDAEYIVKTVEASAIFVDPEICRKIYADGQGSPAAAEIYIGYGV